jgi:flagellar protein FliS
MLYDKAIRHLDGGLELLRLEASDKDPARIEQISKAMMKAQEIITELMVSLDFEQGGTIAKNLFALYTWFNQELLESGIDHDEKRVIAVRTMLNNLRSAWIEIAAAGVENSGRQAVGLNIAG